MELLTVERLENMPDGYIFRQGAFRDAPDGDINYVGTGLILRWIAKRGNGFPDWAIYVGRQEQTVQEIAMYGDKIHSSDSIRRLVPCTDEALARYRY